MKKCGFLSCMLLFLCLLFSLTGCVGYYMDEDSLQTEINQFDSLGYSSVSGGFTLLLSGTAIKIEYDVVGLDSSGEELWRETKSTSGPYTAEDSPLTLSVYCSEVSLSTSSVRVENIRVTGQGEYWLIALFAGLVAAGLGAALIVFAVRGRRNKTA